MGTTEHWTISGVDSFCLCLPRRISKLPEPNCVWVGEEEGEEEFMQRLKVLGASFFSLERSEMFWWRVLYSVLNPGELR